MMLDFTELLLENGKLPERSRSSLLVDNVFPLHYQDFEDDYIDSYLLSGVWATLLPAWNLYVNITNTIKERSILWDA